MMKSLLVAGVATLAGASAASAGMPEGAPHQCYGRVVLPQEYQSREVRVMDSPGGVARRVIPGTVEHSWRRVLVRPAHIERIPAPALYRTTYVTETSPGPRHWVREAPRYGTVVEHVVVQPGHWVWERRYGPVASGPPEPGQVVVRPTGVIMCKVWCPAKVADVPRQVMLSPGRAYAVQTTVRHTFARRVLVRPAGSFVREVPAEYRQVAVSRIVSPPRVEHVRIPPSFHTVVERRAVGGGESWAPVVCGGPLSRPALARMQSSLIRQGYDPGPPDGMERPQTYSALRRFQMDHHMPAGQVTVDSARALGVVP